MTATSFQLCLLPGPASKLVVREKLPHGVVMGSITNIRGASDSGTPLSLSSLRAAPQARAQVGG